jgi:hypothetical protein
MSDRDDSNDCARADSIIPTDSSHTSAESDGGKATDKGNAKDELP